MEEEMRVHHQCMCIFICIYAHVNIHTYFYIVMRISEAEKYFSNFQFKRHQGFDLWGCFFHILFFSQRNSKKFCCST